MEGQNSIKLGEECLVKLDELIATLKRARTKSFLEVGYLSNLFFTWSKRKDLRRAEMLAVEVKEALESFKESLNENTAFPLGTTDFHDGTMALDYFLGIYGDWLVHSLVSTNLMAAENTKAAVLSLIGPPMNTN